jgi:hypothetical protein
MLCYNITVRMYCQPERQAMAVVQANKNGTRRPRFFAKSEVSDQWCVADAGMYASSTGTLGG